MAMPVDDVNEVATEPEGKLCGGFVGLKCPAGQQCFWADDCNPKKGGSDCLGVCVSSSIVQGLQGKSNNVSWKNLRILGSDVPIPILGVDTGCQTVARYH
jgi:hypothetical protein